MTSPEKKIDAIIIGKLLRAAKRTTDATGNSFATAVVLAPIREDDTSLASNSGIVNVIVVDETAANVLLSLTDGAFLGIAGELTQKLNVPQRGEPHPSLELLAHVVIPEYLVARKRKAVRREDETSRPLDELPLDADRPGAA